MNVRRLLWIGIWASTLCITSTALAGDWPTYRADAARSGYSAESLPETLKLRWMVRSAPPRPAWGSSVRTSYDFVHQPVVAGGMVVVGSTRDDSVTALNVGDGKLRWRYFTGGPIRFAPACWQDRVFAASDDGHLYALSLDDGRLLWQHRGGPSERMCLGNERMISRWPARGGPVVVDDTVYYAAGIWPSGGVYIHALDAATGNVVWSNDGTGTLRMPQPHGGAEADSGVAPQGHLLATDAQLFVPTGRAVPAAFCRADGQLQHYLLQENGSMGGARALLADRFVINGGCFLEQETGKLAARAGRGVFSVLPDGVLQFTGSTLLAYRWEDTEARGSDGGPVPYRGLRQFAEVEVADPSQQVRQAARVAENLPALRTLFRSSVVFKDADKNVAGQTGLERTLSQSRPDVERLGGDVAPFQAAAYERTCEIIAAADEAICGCGSSVSIVNLKQRQLRWSHNVDGDAIGLAVAEESLIVSTTEGLIYCFAEPPSPASQAEPAEIAAPLDPIEVPDIGPVADEILSATGVRGGFCLDIGCGDGKLALELARRSKLHVVGVESDPAKVARARRLLADAGVYGDRVSIHVGSLKENLFPQYFADLIVSSAQQADPSIDIDEALVQSFQRPNGGAICLGEPGSFTVQRRSALPGAGLWTHQNSNAANTLCSDDTVVRGPLEMAWYRDAVVEIADRHAQGPAPLYDHGILVVEGVHGLCALDAYNGRTRWIFPIENILADWDGVHHDVGVGDTGSNLCLGDNSVFVRTGSQCLKIDLQTGRQIAEFKTPVDDAEKNHNWGYVAFADGLLFGSVLNAGHTVSPRYPDIRLRTESVLLFALDATTGQVRWKYRPEHSIRNNAVAIADGRVYLIDRPLSLPDRIARPQPNGKHRPLLEPGEHAGGTLVALEAGQGKVLWRNDQEIWGTQLAVSSSNAALLMSYQGVKHGFFKLPSEIGGRLAAFATESGQRLWDRKAEYKTRPIINEHVIYAEGGAWDVKTGEEVPWEFHRSYGCGQIAASRHLMLFRSATLGYLDLSRDAGTENFGGIRPSCWFNAIPAGGQVLVPDGSSKCACSYQMRAWLALQPAK